MIKSPRISVIIPCFNEGEWLKKTVLGVLENTSYPDFEIVIVDDASTDGSDNFLKETSLPNVVYKRLKKSSGAIVARNQGAEIATGSIFVFIDGHELPMDLNWLETILSGLNVPNAGAVMIPVANTKNLKQVGYLYTIKDLALEPTWKTSKPKSKQLVPAIAGGCFAIGREIFFKAGGFNPHLKKWGREDLELSLRLWFMGYDLWTLPESKIAHAFDHKRDFEISWSEVDYNICLISDLYFSDKFQLIVADYLFNLRPKTFSLSQELLLKNNSYQEAKKDYKKTFVRTFEDYCREFELVLPSEFKIK